MAIEQAKLKVTQANLPKDLLANINEMIERLEHMKDSGDYFLEYDSLMHYLEWITSLPWDKESSENLDLKNAQNVLDKNHYGLSEVKERILEFLAVRNLRQKNETTASGHAPVLCFVGLQGIGKTTLASSIAEALGRKFARISMGAIGSTIQLRGQTRSLPNAEPGQVIKVLQRTAVKNPVILLDEIDKASGESGLRSDIMATLLEVLDPEQNSTFVDHYVDYPFNLSDVLFVCTANNLGTLSAALLDRLEIIQMPTYTDQEKIEIGKVYLLPKIVAENGLQPDQLTIAESVWPKIVRPLGYDAGVRMLNRNISSVARKVAKKILLGEGSKFQITEENLKEFLPTW
ncbi:MAG: AAA family ATPase [Patescibacteria group bacterium]|nr:AAA family ATPase [Patescibacteria group bacterium]